MKSEKIKQLINLVSLLTVLAGAFGMLFCFPFLWSARMEDLIGAGLPFVSGAILFGSGLISLALNNKNLK